VTNDEAATNEDPRLTRERETIAAMIEDYCLSVHVSEEGARAAYDADEPCVDCAELLTYASQRIERCPYGGEKPACARCPIHCYQARRRAEVKTVMRFAGPRMMLRHPYLALRHWLDGRRPVPPRPRGSARAATTDTEGGAASPPWP
jgi:hypothetical protein